MLKTAVDTTTDEEVGIRRKILLEDNLDLNSALNSIDSQKVEDPLAFNFQTTASKSRMNFAYQTSQMASPKSKNVFGIRRNTFQANDNVLAHQDKGPAQGVERFGKP